MTFCKPIQDRVRKWTGYLIRTRKRKYNYVNKYCEFPFLLCHTTDVFFCKDCFIILTDAIRQWNGYEGRCFVFHSENCRTIDEISVGVQLSSYKVLHWKALERYSWTGTASLQSLKNCNSFKYIFVYNFMYLFFLMIIMKTEFG